MANGKEIFLSWSETGATVYCMVTRDFDSYLINDADGDFAASPADPYVSLIEHSVLKGRYELTESRKVWGDSFYLFTIYKQNGASPSPVADTIIGTGTMLIESDLEINPDSRLVAIVTQTDKFQFDVSNNVKSTRTYKEGEVVTHVDNDQSTFKTDLAETADDYWVGAFLKFTSGTLIGQVKKINTFNATTKFLTFTSFFTGIPAASDTFKIINE